MNRNHPLKNIPRMILAFIASVFLLIFVLTLGLRLTLFNENHMKSVATQTNYYTALTEEIKSEVAKQTLGSNIPESVSAKFFSEASIRKNVENYIHATYSPAIKYQISGEADLKKKIVTDITNYAKKNQKAIVSKASVDKIATQVLKIHNGYIELPFLLNFGQKIFKFEGTLTMITIMMGILWFVMMFILLFSLRGYQHRMFRFASYSLVSSGLMGLVFPICMLVRQDYKRVKITSKAMYDFLTTYISSFLWEFIFISLALVVLGVVCAFVSEKMRKRLIYG